MVELVNVLAHAEKLLDSDMIAILVGLYVFLLLMNFVTFVNIYSIDKHEFLNNTQKCIGFKRRIPFIIMFSKTKNIVSKKTLIFELIGYGISIGAIATMIVSFFLTTDKAYILVLIWGIIILVYGSILGYMARNIKN